jgi:hypothetical protein
MFELGSIAVQDRESRNEKAIRRETVEEFMVQKYGNNSGSKLYTIRNQE